MSDNNQRRIVVTGMGAISALGNSVEQMWTNLVAGKAVARRITRFDPSRFAVQIACEVTDFHIENYADYIDRKEARRMDPFLHYTIAATVEAIKDAALVIDDSNADAVGALVGSGIGGLQMMQDSAQTLFEKGPMRVSPFTGPFMIPNMAAGEIAIIFGPRGPNFSIASACATGTHAVGEAYEIVKRGDAEVMVTGGTEASLTELGMAAFHRTGAMSTRNDDPEHASRPFDAKRDGFVFGEGAGILILESLEHARQRGAKIHAEVVGYGATDDAFHISAPAPGGRGAARAMQRALAKAGLRPSEVDYINAHGTSTPPNDASETQAIKTVFGEHAYRIPVSSSKCMLGHMLGAAGAVEAIASVKTIETGMIHPTINYDFPDPECDLDYVPNKARPANVRVAMSNSFGFGGHNAILIFRKYES